MSKSKISKGGKVLGIGRDGCVLDPAVLCSTKSNPSDYKNQVSKLIDISRADSYNIKDFVEEFNSGNIFHQFDPSGENFLPGLEMCYKKYHQLNNEQKKDISICKYNSDSYESTYINILLKKGLSFQKITQTLNQKDFLRSLGYLLLGAKSCIHDLNILLLDVKADNLLYSEDKDGKFPVFIDFSNDFVITNQSKLIGFMNGFSSYYNTWSTEMLMFFYKIQEGRKNHKKMKELEKSLSNYRGIELKNKKNKDYMNDLTKNILKDVLLSSSRSVKQMKALKEFYEKQMCFAIGRIYTEEYDKKIKKQSSFKNKEIEHILDNLVTDSYYDRFMIDDALHFISIEVKLNSRKDYLIRNIRTPSIQPTLSPAIISSLNRLVSNMRLTPSQSQAPLPSNLRNSPMTPPPGLTRPSKKKAKMGKWVRPKNLKNKKKKTKARSISYDLKDITPKKIKKMKRTGLVKIVRKYKKTKCQKITGLKKNEIIDRILLFKPEMKKKDLRKISPATLKKMLKENIKNLCKVKLGAKKKVLYDFILKNIVV